jgi:hypothetical protein
VKITECCREQDVLDALTSGRWPGRADEDLRAHVADCELCADVVDVAGALLVDRDDQPGDARIPSSAVVWWRAQRRARQEAAREAARPITVALALASVAAVGLTVSAIAALSPWLNGLLRGWMSGMGDAMASAQAPAVLLAYGWMLPALIIGVWLVLAPVAIYFAVADD